jgi:hypothetical protein
MEGGSESGGWLNQHAAHIQHIEDVLEMKRRGTLMDSWQQYSFTFKLQSGALSWIDNKDATGDQLCEIVVSKYRFRASSAGLMRRKNRIDVWGLHTQSKQEIAVALAALNDTVFMKWKTAFDNTECDAQDVGACVVACAVQYSRPS